MSFSDQEFDEVRDERESKSFRVVKNTFKGILYGASALVWVLILAVLFTTREADLYTEMQFTDATQKVAEETEDYKVHQVIIMGFMNQQGSITLSSSTCFYAKETQELEIGVKYNKKLTDNDTEDAIVYKLVDKNGKVYPVLQVKEDAIGRYGYARVCFGEIEIPTNEKGNLEFAGMELTLTLYRKSDGELLATYEKQDGEDWITVNDAEFIIVAENSPTQKKEFED
ncbi:MAG: hypothetical protein IJX82_09060 [Clostridia bacterium]|nr:hypothetical protein [Clostridia bacterium]